MNVLNFLLSVSLLFPLISSRNTCPPSSCNSSTFNVQFPFGIQGHQPKTCRFPGFDLSCNKQGLTVLNLSHSGEFLVRHINYQTQEIHIYDPNKCLPKRLLRFNLSNSPFTSAYYVTFTFLTCPTNLTRSRYTVIDCLSDSKNKILATISFDLATKMSLYCKIIGEVPIPVSRPGPYDDDIFPSELLHSDLQLTWDVPNCKECEARSRCGVVNNSSQATCFYDRPGTGKSYALQVFKIISLSMAIPAIVGGLGITFFTCFIGQIRRNGRTNLRNSNSAIIIPQAVTIISTGLDESTIESYTKVTLGESKRLPGPSDGTCAICLSDFCAKEMVRIIPECNHCFHANCIDEWLRMKSTCPICRNSPSPSPPPPPHVQENVQQG